MVLNMVGLLNFPGQPKFFEAFGPEEFDVVSRKQLSKTLQICRVHNASKGAAGISMAFADPQENIQ